jgi:thioredoxin-related protein
MLDPHCFTLKTTAMKKGSLIAVSVLLALVSSAQVSFNQANSSEQWDRLIAEAAEKERNIFVDVTADWCGFCKMMDRDVFSDKEVGSYLNSSFVPVKIDADLAFGSEFSSDYGISGLPTFLVLSPEGELIDRLVGYQGKSDLIQSLEAFETALESIEDLYTDFKNGELNTKSMMSLTKRLMQNEDTRWEIVSETATAALLEDRYLSEDEMDFIAFYPIAVSSVNYSKVINPLGPLTEEYRDYFLYESMMQQLYKAIESNDISLLKALDKEMLPAYCEEDEELRLYTIGILKRYYFLGVEDLKGYHAVVMEEWDEHFQDHEFYFYNEASNLVEFAADEEAFTLVKKYTEMYLKEKPKDIDGLVLLVYADAFLGNKTLAYEHLNKAKGIASTAEEKETLQYMEEVLDEF